jgi:prepilin-type N-terminal cleavage/methylation domain-containing protein
MQMTSVRSQHGFTLVELLVAMALAMIVFGATLTAFDVFQTNNRFDLLRNETQDNARNAIDRLARELRNVAAPSPSYLGALELAEPNSLTFETIDSTHVWGGENSANAIRVRYCLDDSNPSNEIVWRQMTGWTVKGEEAPKLPTSKTCPDLNASDWTTNTQLVQHVTNRIGGQTTRPLFTYGPTGVSEVSKIVSVEPTLYLDVTPGTRQLCGVTHEASCTETQLTSGISLRNVNRQPIAAFTAVERGKHQIILNASESNDPGGLALTYKWWDNGTVLSTTAQTYETTEFKSTPTLQTFKLEVTNPGGLSNSTEKTVEVK